MFDEDYWRTAAGTGVGMALASVIAYTGEFDPVAGFMAGVAMFGIAVVGVYWENKPAAVAEVENDC